MTNETKAPTKEEVERLRRTAVGGLETVFGEAATAVHALADAALLGAQVPGLVADNAALLDALWRAENECQRRIEGGPWSPEGETHLQALLHIIQPAALGAKNSPGAALRASHRAEVSALQARVAELERERDETERERAGWKLTAENRKRWWEEAVAERDALRAQLEDEKLAHADDVQALEESNAERRALRAQLKTEQTALDSLFHAVKAGHTPEAMKGRLRTIERHMENRPSLSAPPAETPATELKEAKRSCNLHADCEAADARARAGGRQGGDEHCNDSDCSDHQ